MSDCQYKLCMGCPLIKRGSTQGLFWKSGQGRGGGWWGGGREREVELWQGGQRTPCNRAPLVGVANLFLGGGGGAARL